MSPQAAMQEKIRKMEDELRRLQAELDKMKPKASQFEQMDTDIYLTEVYNA